LCTCYYCSDGPEQKAKSGLGCSCSRLWLCCITKLKTKHWLGGAHDVRSTVSISLENPSPVSQQCLALWVQTKSIRCASSLPPSLLPTLQTPMSFLDYGVISISDCLSPSPSWACLWAQADLPTTYLPPHHNVVLTMWPYVVDKRIRELCHSSISISFKGHMLFWGKNKLRTANKQICKFHIAHCRIWARGTNQPLYNLTYFI
jgi:hypothetical protein